MVSCNPEVFDLTRTADQRQALISWRLARTYRTELVTPGDLVLLWVGGQAKRGHIPGVWAHGIVVGDLFEDAGGDDWTNEQERNELRPYVPLLLTWLEPPLPKQRMQDDPLLRQIEILRMPRTANPLISLPTRRTPSSRSSMASTARRFNTASPPGRGKDKNATCRSPGVFPRGAGRRCGSRVQAGP
jgi:hypothetical protein